MRIEGVNLGHWIEYIQAGKPQDNADLFLYSRAKSNLRHWLPKSEEQK